MMPDWIQWVNAQLPHKFGADPDDGEGIDCLVMAQKVRAGAGLSMPFINPDWFAMAAAGRWDYLERQWLRLMEPCRLEPYALVLHSQRSGLGVGVVIDDGILIVHHRRGAQWLPMDAAARFMPLEFWRPRDAAI